MPPPPLPMHKNILIVTDEQIATVRKVYNLNQEIIDRDVDYLVEWYTMQPHLPRIELDRVFAEQMLIKSKYSIERTKQYIDNYYSHFNMVPDLYENRDPVVIMQRALHSGAVIPLPRADSDGVRTMILKIGKYDPDYHMSDIYRFSRMMADYKLMRDYTLGERYIYDLDNITPKTLLKLNLSLLKKIEWVHEHAVGTKMFGVHFLNAGAFFDKVMELIKPILKAKLFSRIHFHNSLEDLHKHIPKELLPTEYGGISGSIPDLTGDWVELINTKEYQEWFKYQDKLRTDESKRPGKSILDETSILGIPGTFRQMKID